MTLAFDSLLLSKIREFKRYNIANSYKHIVKTPCVPGARVTGGWGRGCFREEENTSPAVQGPTGRSGRTVLETALQGSVICNRIQLCPWARGAPRRAEWFLFSKPFARFCRRV